MKTEAHNAIVSLVAFYGSEMAAAKVEVDQSLSAAATLNQRLADLSEERRQLLVELSGADDIDGMRSALEIARRLHTEADARAEELRDKLDELKAAARGVSCLTGRNRTAALGRLLLEIAEL